LPNFDSVSPDVVFDTAIHTTPVRNALNKINNMSFERSYSIESNERIKQILIFGDKILLLPWRVTYIHYICKKQ